MARITISDELRNELLRTGQVIELCDADGRRIATAQLSPRGMTLEQLDAAMVGPGELTTAEVSARLKEISS